MADYLILKADAGTWRVTALVVNVDPARKAEVIKQGYVGPGHYAALDWSTRMEFDMDRGPITVSGTMGGG